MKPQLGVSRLKIAAWIIVALLAAPLVLAPKSNLFALHDAWIRAVLHTDRAAALELAQGNTEVVDAAFQSVALLKAEGKLAGVYPYGAISLNPDPVMDIDAEAASSWILKDGCLYRGTTFFAREKRWWVYHYAAPHIIKWRLDPTCQRDSFSHRTSKDFLPAP